MCYFITIGINEDVNEDLRQIVPRGMRINCNGNQFLSKLMGEGMHLFVLTTDGCSCDLFQNERATYEQDRIDILTKKATKKGWSDTKTQRAIGSQDMQPKRDDFVGIRQDVREFVAAINKITPRIGIHIHYYSGDFETEKFLVNDSRSITVDGLISGTESVDEDTLTWVLG